MSGLVGASLSRRFFVSVLATGFFLGVSMMVASVVGAQQTEQMNASWYGPGFEGATTANGETFDPSGYTAAHKTLPFGTTLEVCYEGCVNVRINDRGPFIAGRDLDLSQGAAEVIGLTAVGHAVVNVTYTDGSASAGPSGGGAAQPAASQPAPSQPAPSQPAPSQTEAPAGTEVPAGDAPQANAANANAADVNVVDAQYDDSAADGQYDDSAAEGQYDDSAAGDQYDDSAVVEQYDVPELANAAPEVAPLAPPEPAAVEVAPLELATPGSTVERRIQLAQAAPPENYAGALPEEPVVEKAPAVEKAPKPEEGSVAAVAGMTVLPDTGGLPVAPLAGAALLASLTLLVGVRAFRR